MVDSYSGNKRIHLHKNIHQIEKNKYHKALGKVHWKQAQASFVAIWTKFINGEALTKKFALLRDKQTICIRMSGYI